jgi:hypothetical protein
MHVKQQTHKKKHQTEEIKLSWVGKKEKRAWQIHSRCLNSQVSCTKRKHYDYKTLFVGPAPSRKRGQNRIPTEYMDPEGRNTRLEKSPWRSTHHTRIRWGSGGGAAACDIHRRGKRNIMHATIWSENQTPTKHLQCECYGYECLTVCERIRLARSTNQQQSFVSKVMTL